MPRLVMTVVPGSGGWIQISLPVAASSATMELSLARTYIEPSTTSGLKEYLLLSPVGYVQATSSLSTLDLSIC